MKTQSTHIAPPNCKIRALILLGALAGVMITVACSKHSKPAVTASGPVGGTLRPAAFQTAKPVSPQAAPVVAVKKTSSPKPSASKLMVFRSRDYGVSFLYPWQYAYMSAKAVAHADDSLRPKSDGHDGQFTLARIDIPKGFYSETNYESGYLTLSLNQDVTEEECNAVLGPGQDGKLETETVNGVEFRWFDTDNGGRGRATRLRQYVAFTNATCYEVEMGVKTSSEGGLAREVDPDQVLRRLDAILRTVKIFPQAEKPAASVVESSSAVPPEDLVK